MTAATSALFCMAKSFGSSSLSLSSSGYPAGRLSSCTTQRPVVGTQKQAVCNGPAENLATPDGGAKVDKDEVVGGVDHNVAGAYVGVVFEDELFRAGRHDVNPGREAAQLKQLVARYRLHVQKQPVAVRAYVVHVGGGIAVAVS